METGKQQWRGGALLGPVPPVMVTVADPANTVTGANVITIAWTGIVNTIPPKTYISVRPGRYSYALLTESREFVINLTTQSLVRAADFCGIHTGRKVDKLTRCQLHTEPANIVSAPLLRESPLSLECRITDIIPMGSHDMLLADILAVDVDGALIDENGKLHLERAALCAFAHGTYYALGERLGEFGFSVAKKKTGQKFVTQPTVTKNTKPKRERQKLPSETHSKREQGSDRKHNNKKGTSGKKHE